MTKQKNKKWLMAGVLGTLAGAVGGLLLAPQSGKKTRQQIANMTGLRVETVIRTIRHLNEIGSLDIVNGKVFI